MTAKSADSIKKILMVGPRGIKGLFGWTFFDPANLVCVVFLVISGILTVISMRDRLAADWYMPIGLYLCLATLLRGYIFNYYHGRSVARFLNLLILVSGLLASALLWKERATQHEVLRDGGIFQVAPADGFHVASILHLASAIALAVHFLLPRHWLIKMTDQMVEKAGQEEYFAEEAAAIQMVNRDSLDGIFGPSQTEDDVALDEHESEPGHPSQNLSDPVLKADDHSGAITPAAEADLDESIETKDTASDLLDNNGS